VNTFFICALPRSRTAWLANFLSYNASHCFHEPFNECGIEDLPLLFRSTGKQYVGTSDSLNTLLLDRLLRVFPAAKLVLVRRPALEVLNSLTDLGWPAEELINRMSIALDQIEEKYNPLVVNFHDFDAPGIWNFLMPEVPLNKERTKMLETFNVTVPKEIILRKAKEFVTRHEGLKLWD
jgi:hypothetical protein